MPQTRTITQTVYQFDELGDAAKEKARDWYREAIDESDFSCEVDEFVTIASAIGIDFDTHQVQLMSGKTRSDPNIYWSGFCSQGDGACFEGTYDYKADAVAKLRAIANDDTWEPIRIATELARIQAANAFGLRATIKHSGSYYHEHSCSIDVEDRRNEDRVVVDDEAVAELMRDLMRWLYKQLRDQSEYLQSDEAVEESICANEYEFDEDGGRL